MGCDIHIILERKDLERGHWVGVRDYAIFNRSLLLDANAHANRLVQWQIKSRNYEFFNDLCGVRGDGSQFGYEPKGLPDDASNLTLLEIGEDDDLHSHSFLSIDELEPVLRKHWPELLNTAVAQALEGHHSHKLYQLLIDDDIEDTVDEDPSRYKDNWRLVFAFDN